MILFVAGYLCIALESLTRVNKAAIALLMCVGCWTLLMFVLLRLSNIIWAMPLVHYSS